MGEHKIEAILAHFGEHTGEGRGRESSLFDRCGLFKLEPDFEVCGEAENGKEAIEKAWELHPDLIVLDFSMRTVLRLPER